MFPGKSVFTMAISTCVAAGLLFAGCGGVKTSIAVVVTDYSGAPLAGAKVVSMIQPEGQSTLNGITTKDSNKVEFKNIKAGQYNIQISAPDYETQDIKVIVAEGQEFVAKVYLVKGQSQPSENIQGD
jgi:uncharacterized protein YfaS (alpha-2-macroglobulin family)